MVRRDLILSKPLPELVRHSLGQRSRVNEHERRPVLGHVRRDPIEDLAELIGRERRLELAVGHLEPDLQRPPVPAVDDRRHLLGRAHEQASRCLERLDRCREADPDRGAVGDRRKPFQREREVRPTLVAGQRVDLVHDYGLDRLERLAGPLCG